MNTRTMKSAPASNRHLGTSLRTVMESAGILRADSGRVVRSEEARQLELARRRVMARLHGAKKGN